ncbi:MAG: hypothetical protein ACQESR_21865, partial [Planctomycetota bacterium]
CAIAGVSLSGRLKEVLEECVNLGVRFLVRRVLQAVRHAHSIRVAEQPVDGDRGRGVVGYGGRARSPVLGEQG